MAITIFSVFLCNILPVTVIAENFEFLGFQYRMVRHKEKKMVLLRPKKAKLKSLVDKVRTHIKSSRDKTVEDMIKGLNPILRGWVNYYRIGHSTRVFQFIKGWVEKKVRRFARRAQGKMGFGWKKWSSEIIYNVWGLYNDYQVRYYNM